jgi:hypothetical protein
MQYSLQPGDILVSSIFPTGLTKHYVVYLGILGKRGIEWVSENDATEGVRLVPLQDYLSLHKPVRVDRFVGNERDRIAVVRRACAAQNKPYDLIRHNCEHHATFVRTGIATSKQVLLAATLVVIAAGYFICKNNS